MVLECSDVFLWFIFKYIFGGTIWSSILFLSTYHLTIVGHFLPTMWIFGCMPLLLNCVWSFVISANCSATTFIFNTSASIVLELW